MTNNPQNSPEAAVTSLIQQLNQMGLFHKVTIYTSDKRYCDKYVASDPDMQEIKMHDDILYYVKNMHTDMPENTVTIKISKPSPLYVLIKSGNGHTLNKINTVLAQHLKTAVIQTT